MDLDPGLQAERTLLAWRRTSLSIATGGALLMHLSIDPLAPVGLGAGILCLALSGLVYVTSSGRYRSVFRNLYTFDRGHDVGIAVTQLAGSLVMLNLAVVGLLLERAQELLGS